MRRIIIWVLTLWAASLAANGCGKNDAKVIPNKDYSVEAEMQKDYYLIKVISTNEQAIDSYGKKPEENQWYIVSRKSNTLTPISFTANNGYSFNDVENADRGSSFMRVNGDVKSEVIDNFICKAFLDNDPKATVHCNIKVKILLFGPQYLDCWFDGQTVNYELKVSQ